MNVPLPAHVKAKEAIHDKELKIASSHITSGEDAVAILYSRATTLQQGNCYCHSVVTVP